MWSQRNGAIVVLVVLLSLLIVGCVKVKATAKKSGEPTRYFVTVDVNVVDSDGKPVSKAKVEAKFWWPGDPTITATTNAQGNATVKTKPLHADPSGQKVKVVVTAPDGNSETVEVTVP